MIFAAIETATEWCSVALWRDGEILSLERRAGNRQGEFVLPMLESLLKSARLGMREVQGVAYGAGPGAFTGLRIACGVAQGLAFARNLPVVGVSTLEAAAEESGGERVIVALDARMHEVYYAAFEKRAGAWMPKLPECCVAPDAVDIPDGDDWLGCGSGFAVYRERIGPRLAPTCARIAPEVRPSAVAVARLAAPRFEAGQGADSSQAVPNYIRDKVAFTTFERTGDR